MFYFESFITAQSVISISVIFYAIWSHVSNNKKLESLSKSLTRSFSHELAVQSYTKETGLLGKLEVAIISQYAHLTTVISRIENAAQGVSRESLESYHQVQNAKTGIDKQQSETSQVATAINEMSTSITEVTKHVSGTARQAEIAFDLAKKNQQESDENGFFGVNMASTGCGKTIGNARIMYALSSPEKGARFTIALGLRILTLQTGQSFRKDLKLDNDQLAVLVGGASKDLFNINEEQDKQTDLERYGSESIEPLLHEWVDEDANIDVLQELGLGTVVESKSAQALLASPIVSCTVDHIIQASECKRGGKYIAPMLRLLSGDLILDEPDDFNHEDLPALARLVHMAGLLGSKVLLSSATLPPDLIAGLFKAYKAGRVVFNQSQNKPAPQIVCAWFDENRCQGMQTSDNDIFNKHQQNFSENAPKAGEKNGQNRRVYFC